MANIKVTDEQILDFYRSGRQTESMSADARELGYKNTSSGYALKLRLEKLFKNEMFTPEEAAKIRAGYPKWGQNDIDTIPDDVILRFYSNGMRTNSPANDARALGYGGKTPDIVLKNRLKRMVSSGVLSQEKFTQIKDGYPQWQQKKTVPISDKAILDFYRTGRQTHSMTGDAKAIGFRDKNPSGSLKRRLERMAQFGVLSQEEFTQIKNGYPQWGQKSIDSIPDEVILNFYRSGQQTQNMTNDAKALGYRSKSPGSSLKSRLESMFKSGVLTQREFVQIKDGYPNVTWDSLPSETVLRQAWEEGMDVDEIAIELRVTKGSLRAKFEEMRRSGVLQIDDTRRVPREEFLEAVRGAGSLEDAARDLGLSMPAVMRRASRYLKMEVLNLEATDVVRWEEKHIPESVPKDSPAAVLCAVKALAERFRLKAKPPTLNDVVDFVRLNRERVEQHFELLVQQGLLEREALATPEAV